jgi:hypothetical protein
VLKEIKKCPVCGKRVFDIIKPPNEHVDVELKCRHCGKIVTVICGKIPVRKQVAAK